MNPQRRSVAGEQRDDETALLRQVSEGDEQAFGQLYRNHSPSLYNYILRLVRDEAAAENLLQDLFVVVWQTAAGFRGGAQVRTWLFRIAHHQAISWLRRERLGTAVTGADGGDDELDSPNAPKAEPADPEALAMLAWHADRIRGALDGLSADHRAVIELVFFHELSYAEVSEVMDCPIGTVKSRMSWARRYLADTLKDLKHVS